WIRETGAMGLTAAEKIFSEHAGRPARAGEIVTARLDRILLHDITGPVAIEQLQAMGARRLAAPDAVVLVNDHFAPAKDVASARNLRLMRDFATAFGAHLCDVGEGIEHTLLPERGLVAPGDIVIGTDSHTCTYGAFAALGIGMGSSDVAAAMALGELWFTVPATLRALYSGTRGPFVTGKDLILALLGRIGTDGALGRCLEFTGEAVAGLAMDERMALCNMAVEAGATTCFVPPDTATRQWAAERGVAGRFAESDPDAAVETIAIALNGMGPLCA